MWLAQNGWKQLNALCSEGEVRLSTLQGSGSSDDQWAEDAWLILFIHRFFGHLMTFLVFIGTNATDNKVIVNQEI